MGVVDIEAFSSWGGSHCFAEAYATHDCVIMRANWLKGTIYVYWSLPGP